MPDLWLICVVLVAPVPYWLAGLPIISRTSSYRLAPVFGAGLIGWYAELGYISGLGSSAFILVALALSIVAIVLQRPDLIELRKSFLEGYLLYLVALLPALISPFPILGGWDGDWFLMYRAGQVVMNQGALTGQLLERPPFGGAYAVPLFLLRDGLPSYQLACTVSSAGLLAAIYHGYRFWGGQRPVSALLVPLAGSVFFLHHTAAAWVKPLAAGLVVTSVVLGIESRRSGHGWWRAAVAFALAVAAHHSSILYIGFAAIGAWIPGSLRSTFIRIGILAVAGVVIVGSYEAWSIATHGMEAKKNANPSVAQRQENVGFVENTVLVGVSSIVPWSNFEEIHRLFRGGRANLSKNAFWVSTGWLTTSAGTILGLVLPFLPVLVFGNSHWKTSERLWWLLAILLAFVGNALLTPFYSPAGTAQSGVVQLEALLMIVLLLQFDYASLRARRLTHIMIWILAILPFVAVNGACSFGLKYSAGFRKQFEAGSESDWTKIITYPLEPLGLILFPIAPVIVVLTLICLRINQVRSKTG